MKIEYRMPVVGETIMNSSGACVTLVPETPKEAYEIGRIVQAQEDWNKQPNSRPRVFTVEPARAALSLYPDKDGWAE